MPESKDFLTLAQRDYKICLMAEREFPDEYAVSAATYHMQQAVEKALKGLILIYGEEPEYTHNIAKLIKHCRKLGIEISETLDDLSDTLTAWEALSRYDPFINFSESKYEKAKTVYNELHQNLSQELSTVIEVEEN